MGIQIRILADGISTIWKSTLIPYKENHNKCQTTHLSIKIDGLIFRCVSISRTRCVDHLSPLKKITIFQGIWNIEDMHWNMENSDILKMIFYCHNQINVKDISLAHLCPTLFEIGLLMSNFVWNRVTCSNEVKGGRQTNSYCLDVSDLPSDIW